MSINLSFSSCDAGESTSFLVRRYLFLDSGGKSGTYSDKHIPDGSCTLIFNFSGEVDMHLNRFPKLKLPPYFLTLPYPGPVYLRVVLPSDTFGVTCKASVFSSFFNIPLNTGRIPSFRLINDIIPSGLYNELKIALTPQKRIRIFENFIRNLGGDANYEPDDVDIAYERIYSDKGLIHVKELTADMDLNGRTFRRNFNRRVGVSAKSLCRIVRTAQVFNDLSSVNSIDFQDIVYSRRYFDQPHFVNDFHKFTGESPAAFFHRDLRLVKLFSGL